MELTPFTLEEADEVCEDFEDLIDTDFKIGSSPVMYVMAVLTSPFSDAAKADFAEQYYNTKSCDAAMGGYAGSDYDVILITCEAENESSYSVIGIREFAELRGIKYEFPVKEQ